MAAMLLPIELCLYFDFHSEVFGGPFHTYAVNNRSQGDRPSPIQFHLNIISLIFIFR